jgi:5-methylcytosine-specific restriction endonuclease McrA
MICSVPFTRTKGRIHCCSPECSAEAQRNKDRREGVKRRGADKGIPYTLLEVAADSQFCCHLCGEPVDMALPRSHRMGATVDHVLPISLGGLDCATNVKLAHKSCNSRRGNRDVDYRPPLRVGSNR